MKEKNLKANVQVDTRDLSRCGPTTCSASDLYITWDSLNQVFDFQNRPTAFGRLKWYISKTGNPPSVYSLSSFLIYLPEIEMAKDEMAMSLSELQNHYHQLALALRNHATSDLMAEVRKQLDKNLHQSLLAISPSSLDMDLYIASLQTSASVLRQYVTERKVRIPSDPIFGDSGMEIHLGEVVPRVSEQAQEPFGNMSPLLIDDVRLEFCDVSFWQNVKVDSPDEVGLSPTTCSAGAIPWDFTPEEKEEVINHIRSLGPQYQNSTVILDKSDIPEDLLDQVSFADRDEDEVRNASRQFLSNLRRHREIQNQNPQLQY